MTDWLVAVAGRRRARSTPSSPPPPPASTCAEARGKDAERANVKKQAAEFLGEAKQSKQKCFKRA
ncbi:hypothetical protein HJFPF1_11291 [Paramyrothecium foliicola]|nr:hypothetical protein HJFPF1_11291 [Paramyrothecium foliicola]